MYQVTLELQKSPPILQTVNVDDEDLREFLSTKAKMAYKFLENGDKVKVSVRFRGRELGHKEIGVEVINKFIDLVKEVGTPDKAPRLEGNTMIVMLDPKKN